MAIYHQDIADIELNSGSLHRSFLGHSIGMGDAAANRFGVRVFRDGVAETLSGVTCQGFFRNANGENIALTSYGTVDGNVAYVTLPQACYNVEGMFTLAIKLVGSGVTGTMRIVDGVVDNTNTGGAVAPTGSVPTYQEVLSVYSQMQAVLDDYADVVATQNGQIDDLKSALDKLFTETNLTSQYIEKGYIQLAVGIGNAVNIESPTTSNARNYIVVPCKKDDKFLISGTGGAGPRLWGVLDSQKKLLNVAQQESVETNTVISIDQDGYFVSNVYRSADYSLYYYTIDIVERLTNVQVQISELQETEIENVIEIPNHYYLSTSGDLHHTSNNFTASNMIKVSPGDTLKITTAMGDNVGVVGYNANGEYITRIADTNGGIYLVERGVKTTEITIPENVKYITVSNVLPNDTNIIVTTDNKMGNIDNPTVKILIVPDNADQFTVYIVANNGSYLAHRFVKQYYSDMLSYGDGLSKNIVGADVWYSDLITHNGVNVMAGNFNFIHNISNMEGHNGYVGAGHGCTVADWTIFKTDGKLFDPSLTTKMIPCSEFDFTIKAKNYLIDKPNSPSESHAVPTLDESGNPIITSLNIINARMKADNEIEYRNRLILKMDGIQFRECHGSMCEGYFSAFNNVIVSNLEESWNYLDSANDYAREKMNGTQWDIFTAGSKKALSVIMFGDRYKVENKLIQLDGSRNKITNTRSEIYRTGGARMKIYLMPVVCTISAENIADGATVETFNAGDIIDCISYRKISVSD